MSSVLPRSILFVSAASLLVAAIAAGCAADPAADPPTDDDASSGSGASGGSGGTATVGGMGGMGGDLGPCGTNCSAIAAPACHVSVCDESSGQCAVVPGEDGEACDDGQFCTISDTCQAGVCTGGPQNDCGMNPTACEEVTCDETSMQCSLSPLANGTMCQDPNDLCLTGSTCSNGLCVGGMANDCFLQPVPDECHVSVCNPQNGMCEPQIGNEGGNCNDPNDLCTVDKTCVTGVCQGGNPKDCSQLTSGCDLGVCDTLTGQCVTQTVMNGQACDDLDACTMGEICTNSVCGGGSPVTTCSQTADGCCPNNCTANNDYDCNCPGTFVNGTCVYLADPNGMSLTAAQQTCAALGNGWGVCNATILCDTQTLTYLGGTACDCNLGATNCACGSAKNLYIHTGGTRPHYIRTALVPNCNWAGDACTMSGSETCGAALCCK